MTGSDGASPRPACPRCGGRLHLSHREYAGGGASRAVQRCATCGHTQAGAVRPDAGRTHAAGRSRRHQPVDEGPPSNPVIDPAVARRLLEELGG